MKKHVEAKEQKLNIVRKGERGSITLFVLIAMMFFLTVGIAVYIANVNNSTSQQRDVKKIQSEYNSTGNVNQIYNDQKDKLDQKLFITVRDVDGNIYQDGTWINGNKDSAFNKTPLTVEVTWPDGLAESEKYITIDGFLNPIPDNEIGRLKIDQTCTISATLNGKMTKVQIKVDTTNPKIDNIKPNGGKLLIDDTGNLMNSPIITATDSESGIEKVQYAWVTDKNQLPADSEWTDLEGATGSITKEITDSSIEKYYLCVKATDKVGNENVVWSNEYKVITQAQLADTIKISQTPEDWTNKDVTVTIDYGDILTDIKRYGFGEDETTAHDDAFNKAKENDNPIVISIPENGIVYAYGQNTTYSIEASKTHNITNIDKIPPTISVSPESSTLNKLTSVTITASDEGGSGLSDNAQYKYNLGTSKTEVPTGDFKTYENGTAFEIGTDLTGTYYLWVQEVQDNAKNASTSAGTKQDIYHIFGPYVFDNTAPEITANDITYGETLSVKLKDTMTTVTGWAVTEKDEVPTNWEEINSQDITVTKSGLTAGTYYVWAKDSLGNVGSKVIKVNAKSVANLTASLNPPFFTYDGTAKTPEVTLKDGETILTKDTDYTVEYKDNINAGTAMVIITGKGNYTGTKTVEFTINKKEIQKTSSDYNGTYDGNAHTITFSVTEPTSDCTVYYSEVELTSSNYADGKTNINDVSRTDAGTTTIYWYVHTTNGNYADIKGSNKIIISKAEGSVTVEITGPNIAGNVLTANATTLSDGAKTYKWWYADSSTATSGENIPGETNAKYTISLDYIGKYIGCTVNVEEGTNYNACSGSDITDSINNGTEKVEVAHYSITSNSTTTYYATLGNAVTDATQGNTIKAETDYEDSSDVTINKNITFNTNGKTITRTKTITVNSGSTVEIAGSGTLTTSSSINLITNAGTLNITHTGTISNTNTGAYSTISNTGTINKTGTGTISGAGTKYTISGGTLSISNGTISTSGSRAANVSKATVTGGTISSTYGTALFITGTESVESTISGGIIQKSGTVSGCAFELGTTTPGPVTITGGTIKVLTESSSPAVYNNGVGTINIDGATIEQQGTGNAVLNNSKGTINVKSGSIIGTRGLVNNGTGTINIIGGNVEGKTNSGIVNITGTINVSGGTVTGSTGVFNNGIGIINVIGGKVKGTDDGIVDRKGGIVTVGGTYNPTTKTVTSGDLSTTIPEIIGETYNGVDTLNESTTFNFYSGVLKSPNSPAYVNSGTMNVRENYLPKTLDKDEKTGLYSTILAKDISKLEGTLNPTSFIYDGTAKTPEVTVKDGETILTKDTDYTVSYTNNINVGTANAVITGIGNNYAGTLTLTFAINKIPGTATVTITGSNVVGNVLTANAESNSDGTKKYQWYSNTNNDTTGGTKIDGATSSTYTIDSSLADKYIYVVLTVEEASLYTQATASDITDATNNGTEKVEEPHYSITNNNVTTYFITLGDAVKAAVSGDTIKVEKDYEDRSTVSISKNLTLNTNGKTITRTARIYIGTGVTVTISGNGNITTSKQLNLLDNYGTLNITSTGTISNNYTYESTAYYTIRNRGTLNINSNVTISGYRGILTYGLLNITNGNINCSNYAIIQSAWESVPFNTVISGGNMYGSSMAIYCSGIGTTEITGGTLRGKNCAIKNANDGDVIISGGELIAEGTESIGIRNGHEDEVRTGNVTITGGTIKGQAYGIFSDSTGTITVGDANTFSTTVPEIIGKTSYSIYSSDTASTFNFYSGILKGGKTNKYNGVDVSFFAKGTVNYKDGYGAGTTTADSVYSTILVKTSITADPAEYYLNTTTNKTKQITSSGNYVGTVTYTSSDTSIATVSNTGEITALKAGTCTITIKEANGGATATCNVIIEDTLPIWTILLKSIE